jgi:hypothetical protein
MARRGAALEPLDDDHAATATRKIATFRKALGETGFIEGQNVRIEYRWADEQNDRLPALANQLVRDDCTWLYNVIGGCHRSLGRRRCVRGEGSFLPAYGCQTAHHKRSASAPRAWSKVAAVPDVQSRGSEPG